jgi:hypothetical protein
VQRRAANRLGSLHLDRGEFALAARWFAALWQSKTSVTRDVLWRAKAAYALKQAGQTELSRLIFDDSVASASPSTSLAGHSREPGKWLEVVRRLVEPAAGHGESAVQLLDEDLVDPRDDVFPGPANRELAVAPATEPVQVVGGSAEQVCAEEPHQPNVLAQGDAGLCDLDRFVEPTGNVEDP